MGPVALVVAIFFFICIMTISIEAVFKDQSKKNLDEGIKEEEKPDFPPPELEQPKKD